MATFVTELWESVFTPGTTPALIKATHGSFVLLILSLLAMIYMSRSIHFVNLLVISLCLWGAVTWFLKELAIAKREKEENGKENEGNGNESTEIKEVEDKKSI